MPREGQRCAKAMTENGFYVIYALEGRLARLLSRVVMFHLVCYGWLLFRATPFLLSWTVRSPTPVRGSRISWMSAC